MEVMLGQFWAWSLTSLATSASCVLKATHHLTSTTIPRPLCYGKPKPWGEVLENEIACVEREKEREREKKRRRRGRRRKKEGGKKEQGQVSLRCQNVSDEAILERNPSFWAAAGNAMRIRDDLAS